MVALYAAYGVNLHPEQMLLRAPRSPLLGTGWLVGWRLTFAAVDGRPAVPTIVEDPEATDPVYVAVYDIDRLDEDTLDQWEQTDNLPFRKVKIRVDLMTGRQAAWAYVLDAYEGGFPTPQMLAVLAQAAEAAGAPTDYVQALCTRPTLGGGDAGGD